MKRGVNILWICYTFLVAVVIALSVFNCIRYVPTYYEGLAFEELSDGTTVWHGFSGIKTLPEPSYSKLVDKLLPGYILCILAFLPKKKFINIAGSIAAAVQCVIVIFCGVVYDRLYELLDAQICSIGSLHGYHELTTVGIFILILSLVVFAFSVFLTRIYAREQKH